jgi:hypothetical protein
MLQMEEFLLPEIYLPFSLNQTSQLTCAIFIYQSSFPVSLFLCQVTPVALQECRESSALWSLTDAHARGQKGWL